MGSILIVAEIQNGQLREASYELVGFAQDVASASGRDVASLVMGKDASGLADELATFLADQGALLRLAERARAQAKPRAAEILADACLELAEARP